MGVLDKIKNALFEEEYVEVEEKPRKKLKEKKIKEKKEKDKKDKDKVKIHSFDEEEMPIAKKVVMPEKEEVIDDNREEVKEEPTKNEDDFKFPIDMDDDYKEEVVEEPELISASEEKNAYSGYFDSEPVHTEPAYSEKPKYNEQPHKPLYGIDEKDTIKMHSYGTYEKVDDKKVFRPSPIISPIYGVLDKNYKKEEIVSKRESRPTVSYARENLSLDDVRNKAYGREEKERVKEEVKEETKEEKPSVVDLGSTLEKPEVHEITVGDAEEYFEDLGLEYNIDYKDASKEKTVGRREKKHYDEDVAEEKEEAVMVEDKKPKTEEKDDDNLFDLIDSMYEE